MELRHVSGFVAVAEELHFGRAALRLHLSQPTVSRLVRNLENELGVVLLERSTRRVSLTAAGTAFLHDARRGLASFEAGARRARQAASSAPTTLRIGFSECTEEWLPAVLRSIRDDEPAVQLEVCKVDRPAQARQLIDGRLDAAIRRAPIEEPEVETELLLCEPMAVAMSIGHPLARTDSRRLDQMEEWPWVVMPASSAHACLVSAAGAAGFAPHPVEEVASLSSMLVLVSAGVGMALVPLSIARRFSSDDVVYREIEAPAPTMPVMVAWRRGDRSARVQGLLGAVRGASWPAESVA